MSDAPFVIAAYVATAVALALYVRSLRARLRKTPRLPDAPHDSEHPSVSARVTRRQSRDAEPARSNPGP